MALALYRKYRPATFGEVVGQAHVTAPLRTALSAGRINHAYLFSGPRGCGKTSSARILARSLNCTQGPTDEPCGECDSCVALAPEGSGSVDVIELDAASHGGVDDTRELRDRAVFAPAHSRYRIFVIDEAHMVTPQGFNALLKIVEEPPEHLIFVFATTEPDKVLTTIRSRTHHYPFRLLPPGEMRALLERICDEEGVRVEPAVYPLAIRAGGGSARDALSVLDQLLAGAGAEGITYERAVALLGVTDVALIDAMVDALAAGDAAAVYGTVDRVVEAGHDPRRFASDLLDRLRDLVLLHGVPEAAERGLVDSTVGDVTKMQSQAEQLGSATLTRFAEIVHAGLSEMRGATAPRLLLELLCARMMLPTVSSEEAALLQRLERVERRMTIAPSAEAGGEPAVADGEAEAASQRRTYERPSRRQPEQESQDAAPAARQEPAEEPVASTPAQGVPERPAPTEQPAPAPPAAEQHADDRPAGERPAEESPQPSGGQPSSGQPSEGQSAGTSGQVGTPERSAGMDAAAVRQVWSELLRAVAERNRPTQALLLNATVQDLRDGTLVLSMPTSGLLKQFAQPHRIEFVRDAMRAVLGGEWQVECVEAGAQNPGGGTRSAGSGRRPAAQPRERAAPTPPDSRPNGSGTGGASEESRGDRDVERGAARQAPETPPSPGSGAAQRPGESNTAVHGQAGTGPGSAGHGSAGADANTPRSVGGSGARPGNDDIPPPPEPPDEEPPEEEPPPEAEQRTAPKPYGPAPQEPADIEQAAVELLSSELGARRIDNI